MIINVLLNVLLHFMIINKFVKNVHLIAKFAMKNNVHNVNKNFIYIMEFVLISVQKLFMLTYLLVKNVNKIVKNVKMEIFVKNVCLDFIY